MIVVLDVAVVMLVLTGCFLVLSYWFKSTDSLDKKVRTASAVGKNMGKGVYDYMKWRKELQKDDEDNDKDPPKGARP